MQKTEIIIIGAGPGGLACATELKERGNLDVTILEKNPKISYKVCAGGIDPNLSELGITENIIERRFTKITMSTSWQSAFLRSKNTIIATLNRKKLHENMAEKARESGVKILFGEKVTEIKENVVITSSGKEFHFDYLIGADGSNSFVRKSLGLKKKRFILAMQYMIPDYYPDMEFHVDIDRFDMSYAWVFPQESVISVGTGFYPGFSEISMKHLRKNLDEWIRAKFGSEAIKKARFEAFPILFDYQGFEFGNIFLVGDAAGLAHDLTGGGIASAILSGRDVARKIVNPEYDCPEIKKILEKKKNSKAFFELLANSSRSKKKIIIEAFVFSLKIPFFGKKIASRVL